jgi:hypothetical protein
MSDAPSGWSSEHFLMHSSPGSGQAFAHVLKLWHSTLLSQAEIVSQQCSS